MAKRLLLSVITAIMLFVPFIGYTQTYVPAAEQPAYFVYAKGSRSDNQLKILLVSRHIILLKDHPLPAIETGLSLDFDALTENIPYDERYFTADYDNVSNYKVEVEDIYGDYLKWNAGTVRDADLRASDNTLFAMEKIRAKIIEDHQKQGYKVFQIDFNPDREGENQAAYKIYNQKAGEYVNFTLERRSPIPVTWIDYYRKGDIKYLLSQIREKKSGSGGGIVVEDKNKSSSDKSSSVKKSTSDNTDWAARAAVARMQAEAYEAEGDRYNKMGSLFINHAIQQYKLAQQTMYSARVQQKLDGLNSMVQGAQALNQGLEKVEDFSASLREGLDEQGIPRFRGGNFSFSGLTPSYGSEAYSYYPMSASITYGFYRYLALEAGIGYNQSPVYELYLTDKNGYKVDQTIFASQGFGGLEIAVGIAIPIKKSLVVYGTYGLTWSVFSGGATLYSEDYEFPDLNDVLNHQIIPQKFKGGINFRIPKTRIALGAHYTWALLNGEKVITYTSADVKKDLMNYRVGGSVHDKYKYGMFGASIYILSKD